MQPEIPATLIPGDGIGIEIVDATLAALDALGAPFTWDRQLAGMEAVKSVGDPLPAKTIESIRRTRLARTLIPGGRFVNIDLVVVRENLGGLDIGHEHFIQIGDDPHAVATTAEFTRALVKRIANT